MGVNYMKSLGMVAVLLLMVAVAACDKKESGASAPAAVAAGVDLAAHSGGDKGPAGIDFGGITSVSSDPALIAEGKALFAEKSCTACHQLNIKVLGPPLRGITQRREPEWLGRMIKHPDEMLKQDDIAKGLLAEFKTPMSKVEMTNEELAAIIAYLGSEN